MRRWLRCIIAAMMVILAAGSSAAQRAANRVEVFATIGGVVGTTPMLIDNARTVVVHGGFRADAGLQLAGLGVALGARVWELAPTKTFGGHGLDGFITGEWRVSFDTRSIARAAVGSGFDEIDGGGGPERPGIATSGVNYSIGFAREIFVPSGARIILSADVVMPNVNADVEGRRQPILELGFGYRLRDFTPLDALPSR